MLELKEYFSLILLGGYACFLLTVAFLSKRGSEDFYVNSRASGVFTVAFSIIVTCIGASSTLGMVGLSYSVGTPGFWWLGAGALGLFIQALLISRKVRENEAYTMPGLIEKTLGQNARLIISLVISIAWLAILAAQFTAIFRILEPMTGLPEFSCRVIGFILIVMHCLGGQAAIIKADKVQATILIGALVSLLAWLSYINPEWISHTEVELVNKNFPLDNLVYFLIILGSNYVICPMGFSRLLCAKDGETARKAAFLSSIGVAVCAVIIASVGLASRGLVPEGIAPDAVLTTVISQQFPHWMSLLISFALISAVVSSADTCLLTVANIFSYDVLRTKNVIVGRVCVMVVGILGICLSLWGKGILDYLTMSYKVFAGGVFIPSLIGLLISKSRYVESHFSCFAIIVGGSLGIAAAIKGAPHLTYAGMLVSGIVALMGIRHLSTQKP